VGCGFGYGCALLAGHASAVTGVDRFGEGLAYARSRYGGRAAFLRSDALALPFAAARFDLVVCFEVLEHVADAPGLVREVRRVLAQGGLALVSTPVRGASGGVGDPTHLREYAPDEFRAVLEEGGFGGVALLGQHLPPGTWDVHAFSARLAGRDPVNLRRLVPPRLKAAVFSLLFRLRFGTSVRAAAATTITGDLAGAAVQIAVCRR